MSFVVGRDWLDPNGLERIKYKGNQRNRTPQDQSIPQESKAVFQGEMEEFYVRQHSDIRILYENLSERAWVMVLGQLLSQYKLL